MYSYVETGFAEPTEVILSAAFYLFVLCLPIAITYIATGLKGSLLKQVNVTIVSLIIVVAGCFIFYDPSLSFTALALAAINLGVSVHQFINRRAIEKAL
ncbi:hypothetical protein [Pseudomonas mangrovi]|uniref:Uncharacterized protein n=1 Tax=Pseudomonas mangrovi TaxID=2161748 RepID=A0A2T5PAL6_9PSED|nr:hypothetical protein [Pseudomonas mangrovi]PTU74731.1 hypothetical protein DBO85_07450 [Pseudomonas mangrovi]